MPIAPGRLSRSSARVVSGEEEEVVVVDEEEAKDIWVAEEEGGERKRRNVRKEEKGDEACHQARVDGINGEEHLDAGRSREGLADGEDLLILEGLDQINSVHLKGHLSIRLSVRGGKGNGLPYVHRSSRDPRRTFCETVGTLCQGCFDFC